MDNKSVFISSIKNDFEAVKQRCASILNIDDSGTQYDFIEYLLASEGKGIRPIISLLSALLFGEVNSRTITTAAILELTHNASLIHDDVVDGASERRGRDTINTIWGAKKAVLIGDFILSRAIGAAVKENLFYAIEDVAKVIEEMSVGEIEQMDATAKLEISQERYFSVIRRKTAYLIGACCRLGARSAGATEEQYRAMGHFGELVGMMFQIKDDILDYVGENIGKATGKDIRDKKITLPLIYAAERVSEHEREQVIEQLLSADSDDNYVEKICRFIIDNGGIAEAEKRITQFKDEALDILESLPGSSAKSYMIEFVDYIYSREK